MARLVGCAVISVALVASILAAIGNRQSAYGRVYFVLHDENPIFATIFNFMIALHGLGLGLGGEVAVEDSLVLIWCCWHWRCAC